MARDYTKYSIKGLGENLNKRQLVFEIVKDYVEKNKPSFDELTAVFKDEIQGPKGFIKKAAKVEDPKRFNMKMPLKIKYGVEVVVSNQWGSKNIDAFLSLAKKLKYKITFVKQPSSASDNLKPSSNLTTEQITEFKEQEAEINGDYNENSWEASSLYDDLIEAGDTAWADSILQKMEDAAEDFANLETVFEKLKERNETERFLAVIKKAEDKAEATREYTQLAEEVIEIDKYWALKLCQKAEKAAKDYDDLTTVAGAVFDFDKDWAIKIYKKAETLAEDSFNHRDLSEKVYSIDKDWSASLIARSEAKAESLIDYVNLGDTYGNSDLFNDKAKAKAMFEKAFPLIETKWCKKNLMDSAENILGNSDSFTQKIVEFIENDIPRMKLPKQFFPDYKPAFGKIITLNLANGPSCHKIDHFNIKLNMETNEVIGHADRDDHLSRWFDSWEVGIYDGYSEHRSYDGEIRIWGEDDNENEWCVYCHGGFEELEEGDLPDGVTGEDIWNALGNGNAIYELYHHIKQNITDDGLINSANSKPLSQDLNVDIELRKGNQELICTIKNFDVNREDSEVKNMYDALSNNFHSDDFYTLTHYHLFKDFIREIYHEFLTNSQPAEPHRTIDEYGCTIEDMKQDDFDWWENDPILVVTRIGEIDLNPIVNFDGDNENMLNKFCEMFDISEDDKDRCEDYVDDYMSDSRFSVDENLFKEVMQEL